MHPDLTTINSLERETAPTSQKRKWEAQRGKVDTGKSLSLCETKLGVSDAKLCALPANVLLPASGCWFLKETRFLPGAFYVGQIPFRQQPATQPGPVCARTAKAQAQ